MATDLKRYLTTDVLEATRARIALIFDHFPRIYLSGPSGKDSGVMMHLVCEEAHARHHARPRLGLHNVVHG